MSDLPAVAALTTAGKALFAQAISGTKIQIASAHFGSDIITGYSQTQLQALKEVVSNGAASSQYSSDSSVISYLFPQADQLQIRVNLGSSIGDFDIGNWALFDKSGVMLFIMGLSGIDHKAKTSATQAGDNRIYSLNIPITDEVTGAIDFTVLSVDAAALPEVTTENNLPTPEASTYPVFHIQNYNGSNTPSLASRVNGAWYYYVPLSSILADNNTWTGVNTFNNKLTSTNSSAIGSGASDGSQFYLLKRTKATDGSDYGTLVLEDTGGNYYEWHFKPSGDIVNAAGQSFLKTYSVLSNDVPMTQISSIPNGAYFTDNNGVTRTLYSALFLDTRWNNYIDQPVKTTSSPTFTQVTSKGDMVVGSLLHTNTITTNGASSLSVTPNTTFSGNVTVSGISTLSNSLTIQTNGYGSWFRNTTNAGDTVLDIYSSYGSSNNNVARVYADGSINIYGGGRFWENGHNLLGTWGNTSTDRALVQACGNTAGTYLYFVDTDGRSYMLPTQSWASGTYVLKSGDTMTGGLTIEGNTGGFITNYTPTSANNGDYINYPGFLSSSGGRGAQFYVQLQEHVNDTVTGLFSLRGGDGNWRYVGIPKGRRINDSDYGDVAYVSDLGSYVPTSTYASDFSTSDSRIINIAWGNRIQFFTIMVPTNGTNSHDITFPIAFSGAPSVAFVGDDRSNSRSFSLSNSSAPSTTGFTMVASLHGNSTGGSTETVLLSVIAVGPK